jgi:hypothetical protein
MFAMKVSDSPFILIKFENHNYLKSYSFQNHFIFDIAGKKTQSKCLEAYFENDA